jgi:hypothetical protein
VWHVIAATNIVRDCSTQQQSSEVIVEIQEEEELLHAKKGITSVCGVKNKVVIMALLSVMSPF